MQKMLQEEQHQIQSHYKWYGMDAMGVSKPETLYLVWAGVGVKKDFMKQAQIR